MHSRSVAAAVIIASLWTTGWCPGQEYKIQLDRPMKAGAQVDASILGAGRWSTVVSVTGKDPQTREDAFGVSLAGRIEAVAVDDKGYPTRVSVTIQKCAKLTGAAEKNLLEKGDVLIAEMKDGKTRYTLKDAGGVTPEVERALQLVLALHDPKTSVDDALIGTAEAKKVGDSWPISSENVAKDLQIAGMPAKAQDTTGTATLAEAKKVDEADAIVIKAEFKVSSLTGDLPNGGKLADGKFEATYSVTLPVDASLQPSSESSGSKLTTVVSETNPDGIETTVKSTVERSSEGTFKAVK